MDGQAQQTNDKLCRFSSYNPPAYTGLMNQGATCYLNSVLQVLFMTEEFREAVERNTSKNPYSECFELHLTKLFEDLTRKNPVHTFNITQKLGIKNVCEYQDAAEYFEKILTNLTNSEASQIFKGQLTHQNKCSECGKQIDTLGPFWSLPLELVDSDKKDHSVVDGIDKYFRALDVSGANQMYCDHCDAKSDATIKCVMSHHPEVLTLRLKRFKFDDVHIHYVKVKCSVDVPCTLQIPEDETYELYGFVDHFGDLRGGHYTATIKCQDDKRWYNFNDTMVTRLPNNQPFLMGNIMKSSTAYLLFYRKNNVKAAGTSEAISEVSTSGGSQSDTSHSNEQCDVKNRKRETHKEAADVHLYTVVKEEIKKKREREDDQKGKQDQNSVCVDTQRNEKLAMDIQLDKKSKTEAGESETASVSQKLLKKPDLCHWLQNNGVGGHCKENMSNSQVISSTSPSRHEQKKEEKCDVMQDKEQKTTKFKCTLTGDTSMTHQDSGKLGDVRKEQRSGQNSGSRLVLSQEVQITHSRFQSNITNMMTETGAKTSRVILSRQLSDNTRKDIRETGPKEDELDTLSERVRNLNLNDSPPPGSRRGKLDMQCN